MNLVIEQGNSTTKAAIFSEEKLVDSFVFHKFNPAVFQALHNQFPVQRSIFSTVRDLSDDLTAYLSENRADILTLSHETPLPIRLAYDTPETLGKDRIAAVAGANYLQPRKNALIIDAGTAITFDFIDATGLYHGGNISPGMTTRFRALHEYTSKLPLLSESEQTPMIGKSTVTAIQAGVTNGIIFEINGYIDYFKGLYPDLFVFLTGGHSFYFERRLKSSIFADVNLVLMGLNRILNYNVEKE